MNSVEILKEKAESVNLIYLKLLQKYRFDSNELHYVFEGFEDQSFYFNYLQGFSEKFITHISLGKSKSISLYERLDWSKYDKKRIIIFIDKDYCRILNKAVPKDYNIYETTYYSIENYIANIEVLKRLIREILHFHEESEIDKIIEKYQLELKNFIDAMKPILAWILIVRKKELKANLNMINLSKLFQIDQDLNFVKINPNRIIYLEKVTGVKTPIVPFSEFTYWYKKMDSLPCFKDYLRGKFEMWFMITFFNRLNDYLLKTHSHVSKIQTNINHSNAIEIIGPRTVIPKNLQIFFRVIFN